MTASSSPARSVGAAIGSPAGSASAAGPTGPETMTWVSVPSAPACASAAKSPQTKENFAPESV